MKRVNSALDLNGREISMFEFRELYLAYSPPKAKWNFSKIKSNLNELYLYRSSNDELEFISLLHKDFESIIKGTPKELAEFIETYTKKFPTLLFKNKKQTRFGKLIEDTFDYGSFRKTTKANWLAKSLGIKTCLYCNAQSTLIIEKKSSGLLFQFDHFFAKTRYPYLSLSLFNLIPSCSSCNIAKGKSDFNLTNAFHPYEEDISEEFTFKAKNQDVLNFLLNTKDRSHIGINLEHKNLKVQKHIDTFSLTKVFNEHTDFIEELFLKAYYYNKSKQDELLKVFTGIIDHETIMRFILGNYYLDQEINKRPLAKMIKDVAKQIELI